MKTTVQKNRHPGRVFLAKSKNRPYLASCPVHIVNAELFLDLKLQKKVMKLRVQNRGDRAVAGMTIYARYLDRDGNVIGADNGYIVLNFTNIYCAPHETTLGSKTVVLPYQDISGIEAYVGSLTYDSGKKEDFSPEDYSLMPSQDMLENHMDEKSFALLRRRFGKRCVFVPHMGRDSAWLCSCGAVCGEEVCSSCGMKKKHAFALSHTKTVPILLRQLRLQYGALRAVPYVIAAGLLVGGLVVLSRYADRYTEEILPEQRLRITRKYIEDKRFNEALGYSVTKNQSLLYEEIVDAAVAYYCEIGDFENAVSYEKCREYPAYEAIYAAAARRYLNDGDWSATEYALGTADADLRDRVLWKMAETKWNAQEYDAACALALKISGEDGVAYADSILYKTIAYYLERSDHERAVAYIGYLYDKSKVGEVCQGIEAELLDKGQYENAFAVASITGDTGVFEAAYSKATSVMVRRYYDKFFPYMSAEEKMKFLATPLAAGDRVVAITSQNKAIDSYLGELCGNAISVACGGEYVLVLQSDGTVRVFGDNTYGQGNCDGISSVISIAAGENHSLILLADGTVRAYGDNSAGQCDVSSWRNVIAIAAGDRHSVALTTEGKVLACGSNESGQCAVTDYTDVVEIAAGDYATALVFRDGNVAVAGNLALDALACREWSDIVHVSVSNGHLLAQNGVGRVMFAGSAEWEKASLVDGWVRVRYIACGERASYAIDANGRILSCGEDVPDLSGSGWESLKR